MNLVQPPDAPHTQLLKLAGVLTSFVLNTVGCTFDTTPVAVSQSSRPVLEPHTGTAFWSPPGRRGQIVGSAQPSDAALNGTDTPAAEAARDGGDHDAGTPATTRPKPSTADAGRPSRPEQGAAAGSSGGDAAAGSAGSPATVNEPDAGSSICIAGHYDGVFEGSVTFLQGSLNTIKGTIRAALTFDPMRRDYLRVREGTVTGVNDQGAKMNAGWSGALNCETGQLEDAKLLNGAWDNGSRFNGTLTGAYSVSTSTLAGTWQVQAEGLTWTGGNGTWSMQRSATP